MNILLKALLLASAGNVYATSEYAVLQHNITKNNLLLLIYIANEYVKSQDFMIWHAMTIEASCRKHMNDLKDSIRNELAKSRYENERLESETIFESKSSSITQKTTHTMQVYYVFTKHDLADKEQQNTKHLASHVSAKNTIRNGQIIDYTSKQYVGVSTIGQELCKSPILIPGIQIVYSRNIVTHSLHICLNLGAFAELKSCQYNNAILINNLMEAAISQAISPLQVFATALPLKIILHYERNDRFNTRNTETLHMHLMSINNTRNLGFIIRLNPFDYHADLHS